MKILSLSAISVALLLTACTTNKITCPIVSEHIGNGGCLIVHDDKVLMAKHRKKDKWNLPGGTYEPGESAQCAAQRETWEEVGVKVEIGELVTRFKNGFYLYRCHLNAGEYRSQYAVPESGVKEVTAIEWIDPSTLSPADWRYPERWPKEQQLFLEQLQLKKQ